MVSYKKNMSIFGFFGADLLVPQSKVSDVQRELSLYLISRCKYYRCCMSDKLFVSLAVSFFVPAFLFLFVAG